MRNLGIFVAIVVVIVGLLLSSCGGPEAAPTPAPTPPAINANELYATNCAACHGVKREGVTGLGLVLTPESLAALSDAEVRNTILNGRIGTAMPPHKGTLSAEQIDTLLQLIKYTSP